MVAIWLYLLSIVGFSAIGMMPMEHIKIHLGIVAAFALGRYTK